MKLIKMTSNFYRLESNNKIVWFSYEEPIVVYISSDKFFVSDMIFSKTTSKHRNLICTNKKYWVPHDKFLSILERNF